MTSPGVFEPEVVDVSCSNAGERREKWRQRESRKGETQVSRAVSDRVVCIWFRVNNNVVVGGGNVGCLFTMQRNGNVHR